MIFFASLVIAEPLQLPTASRVRKHHIMKPRTFLTLGLLLLILLVVGLFAVRLAAPSDLMDKDQERPASYVLDILQNGHWICQTDWMGSITSKPPLFTWLSALFAQPFDRFNRFALYLPSVLSVLILTLVIRAVGERRFGPVAGFLAALAFVLSPITARLSVLARTDSLFTMTIALTAFAAFRSWEKGGHWIWFWLAAAAATLTKGPLGVLIGAMGLLAVLWEKRHGTPLPLRGSHLAGLLAFLLITFGWFGLAVLDMGKPVVDKMILSELVYHGIRTNHDRSFEFNYFNSSIYFLHRFLPWSVIACIGLWRAFRRPAADPAERRLERFLTCWILGSLIVFSLAPHQRGDLLYPIIAPAALLAGREIARWLSRVSKERILAVAIAFSAVVFGVFMHYYWISRPREPLSNQSEGMRQLAADITTKLGENPPLIHVDDPFALQFFLNTMKVMVAPEDAARQLAGTNPVYAAVCNVTNFTARLDAPVYIIARWPHNGEAFVTILGNTRTSEDRPE